MTTQEIADRLHELCSTGQYEQAQRELYADDAESIEPADAQGMQNVRGLDAIIEKGNQFQSMVEEIHSNEMSRPVVADTHFATTIKMDVTMKGMGRIPMDEVAVYEVKAGKIVKEQFFYHSNPPA